MRRLLRTPALALAAFLAASAVTVVLAAWPAPGWKPGPRREPLPTATALTAATLAGRRPARRTRR